MFMYSRDQKSKSTSTVTRLATMSSSLVAFGLSAVGTICDVDATASGSEGVDGRDGVADPSLSYVNLVNVLTLALGSTLTLASPLASAAACRLRCSWAIPSAFLTSAAFCCRLRSLSLRVRACSSLSALASFSSSSSWASTEARRSASPVWRAKSRSTTSLALEAAGLIARFLFLARWAVMSACEKRMQ